MSAAQFLHWLGLDPQTLSVKPSTLPSSYFKFPPSNEPTTLPPPPNHSTLAHPFTLPADLYNALLSPIVPATIALVYVSIVSVLNSVNANRKYKPWAISRTSIFKLFVMLHNTLLAVYSAWTFVGMYNGLRLSLPSWRTTTSLSETVDVLCKLHGPRGHGSAITYNANTSAWTFTDRLLHLGPDGLTPDSSDVGRLWNEGLAFYGWIFYLSKFYEVIDTFIILAKGKKSSLLQTYHHAGAMLCMWAGIRYMSPPIWMFVFVNSFIHTIMYTFYLFNVIGIKVPKRIKQSLTTLQITQFVVGVFYAFSHLFVAYQIPVSVPYIHRLGDAISSAAATVPAEASSSVSSAIAIASAGTAAWVKKLALRAAGREGLAENVPNEHGRPFGFDPVHIAQDLVSREETRFRDELQWVHCLDTSGQVFAILLNVVYLMPLTWLFAQFFITAYLKRAERRRSSTTSDKVLVARQSLRDASRGVARRLSEVVEEMHRTSVEMGDDEVLVEVDEVREELKYAAGQAKAQILKGTESIKQSAASIDTDKVKQEVQRGLDTAKQSFDSVVDRTQQTASPGRTPNGNGTGAEEATGQSSPEKQSNKKKNKKNKKGGSNGEQESQAKDESSSKVQEGKSFADAAKE
ncbi:hypothetical protein B0A52_08711 [Exophiala mesophila]|uniref:Elongation of fatty acids protein n=1 Tax=Exophiala mesophila TaxID=212818 RepID=A0A438MWW7_EXOME|nr:hypothetical protein B0A52_08711 [Exophiala mesophila]